MNRLLPLVERFFRRPESVLVGTFAGLALLGTVLLSLPSARSDGVIHPFDAAFTATSAVCVTGLIVVDTGTDFTRFGQTVILLLIQLGGLGIMTFAAMMLQLAGRRLSLSSQGVLHDVFFQRSAAETVRKHLKWIVILTFTIEAAGVVSLYCWLPKDAAVGNRLFFCVFHAISAFCNAGFSTSSDSLIPMSGHLGFMVTISALIVLGGLGYAVIIDLIGRLKRRISRQQNTLIAPLHTRVVLTMTLALIVVGAAYLQFEGFHCHKPTWAGRLGHALFQSITARTAGFNTVDIGRLSMPALLWIAALMFIGGSPGSCAGGIKTTTLAIWLARLKARILQREDVTIGGRRIPTQLVRRAALLLGVSVLFNVIGIWALAVTEGFGSPSHHTFRLEELIFEQISAFGTVGLSTGITPDLSFAGKCWIMLTMFVGRLGPLTIMLVVIEGRPEPVRLPEERVMIG